MLPERPWMIYGASGYTGELIAREAVRRGLRPAPAQLSAHSLQISLFAGKLNRIGIAWRRGRDERRKLGDLRVALSRL